MKRAIVTGATRGIGRATAIALAHRGYDVAVTGRTVSEGDIDLPGSLASVTAAIEAAGRHALPVVLDLLDTDRLAAAADEAVDALGGVDVVLNNAIYVGPHGLARFVDTPREEIERRIHGNVTAQLLFSQPIVRAMTASGRGTVAFTTSGAGRLAPPAGPGDGGWALTYGVSKAGVDRIATQLAVEHPELRCLAVDPGPVATERVQAAATGELAFVARHAAPVDAIGETIARILDEPDQFGTGSVVDVQATARAWGVLAS